MRKEIIAALVIFLIVLMPQSYALQISDVQSVNITKDSAIITWKTDEITDSKVEYGTNKSDLTKSDAYALQTTNHSIKLENLESESEYFYQVENRPGTVTDNNSGNYYSFTTLTEEGETLQETEPEIQFTGQPAITLDPMPSTTLEQNFTVKGKTQPGATIRIFIKDRKIPETLKETGITTYKTRDGSFSLTIQLQPGYYNNTIGLNTIKIEATTEDNNRNYAYHSVTLDVLPPLIALSTIPQKTNQQSLTIKGTVNEQSTIQFILNNQTAETITAQETFTQQISLKQGTNTLEIIALDKAGLNATHKQIIELDTTPPKINLDELDKEYHFTALTITGNTSEPNVKVIIINEGETAFSREQTATNVTGGITGQTRGREETVGEEILASPLGAIIGYKKEATSDAEGKFKVTIALNNGTNNLVIIATDEAGNEATLKRTVKMIEGSAIWKVSMITTVPNEVYTDNLKEFDVSVGVMYTLNYFGSNPEQIKSITITSTEDGNRVNNDLIEMDGNPIISWDPEKSQAFIYQKIKIKKLRKGIDIYDEKQLPNSIRFAIKNTISYNLQGIFDRTARQREIYFYESEVSVEKPLDYTKWLTPEFINASIEKLDAVVEFLDNKAIPVARIASGLGLASCVAYTAVTYLGGADLGGEGLEYLYTVCDRTLCPYVPPKCDDFVKQGNNYVYNDDNVEVTVRYWNKTKPPNCPKYEGENLSYFTIETQKKGEYLLGSNQSEQPIIQLPKGSILEETTECGHTYTPWTQASIQNDLKLRTCYNTNAPQFDDSKCLINKIGTNPIFTDVNPYEDMISSTACVCLPGIYGNLQNWRKIADGTRKCLQQAYLGNVQGGYCERLVAQFTCDFITAGLKAIGRFLGSLNWQEGAGNKLESALAGVRKNFNEVNKNLANRYSGIVKNQLGLNTQDLVHKACVSAITGDWSELTNILEQSIRQPVSPVIGPMMPSSRITSYNPFTGKININYLVSLGVMSGGQRVTGKVTLYCDPSYEHNEYCPNEAKQIATRSIIIPIDGSINENWAYDARESIYWANVAVMELEYTLGAQNKKEVFTEPISRKGGLIAQCKWSLVPPQIICEALAPTAEGLIEMQRAQLSPQGVSKYYPGNTLSTKLDLRKIGTNPIFNASGKESKAAMIWEITVPATTGGTSTTITNLGNTESIEKIKTAIENALKNSTESSAYIPIFTFEESAEQQIEEIAITGITLPKSYKENETINVKVMGEVLTGGTSPLIIRNIDTRPTTPFREWTKKTDGSYEYKVKKADVELQSINTIFVQGKMEQYRSVKLLINGQDVSSQAGKAERKIQTKYPISSNYKLEITLWEDVDNDNIINAETDNILKYENKNQTETFRFTFDPNKPDCQKAGIAPKVDIITPREDVIIRNCEKELTVQAAVWDDCMNDNGVMQAKLYHTSVESSNQIGEIQITHNQGLFRFTVTGEQLDNAINKIYQDTKKKPDRIKFIAWTEDNSQTPQHATDSVTIELKCS